MEELHKDEKIKVEYEQWNTMWQTMKEEMNLYL